MVKQVVFATLASSLLLFSSGCGLFQTILYGPCGGPYPRRALCDSGSCGAPCGDECGPGVCRPTPVRNLVAGARGCARCGMDCGGMCDDGGDCGDCGGCAVCGGRPCGPLTWLFSIFRCNTYPCSGCGERYWGDWADSPPDCSDPCDGYGNYTGRPGCQSCGRAGPDMATVPPPQQYAEQVNDDYVPRSARKPSHSNRQYSNSNPNPNTRPQYAPRVLSVTDEVVQPAQSQPAAAAPRVAQPRRTTQRQ